MSDLQKYISKRKQADTGFAENYNEGYAIFNYVTRLFSRYHRGHLMQTLTATEARTNLYRLIDQVAESHQPIAISGKRTSAVLISADDWESIQETLYLLSVPGMRESIKEGLEESE